MSRSWDALPRRTKTLALLAGVVLLFVLAGLVQSTQGLAPARLVSEGNSGAGLAEVGVHGPIRLAFAESMVTSSVESRLSFEPPIAGEFTWEGAPTVPGAPATASAPGTAGGTEQIIVFWPARAFAPGQRFSIRLGTGARSKTGRTLRHAQTWQVVVRQPDLLFLAPSAAPEVWRVSSDGQNRTQLTRTGGAVNDYGVSPDGSRIAYSVRNEQQGFDIWEMDRQGENAWLLLPCGADWCANPAYAPDGNTIAYSRRRVSGISGRDPEMPRIWIVDRAAGSTLDLFADPHIRGGRAYWSPDGQHLAFYDEGSAGVRVYDEETRLSTLYPAAVGTGIAWSADGAALLFLEEYVFGAAPYNNVVQVDIKTQEKHELFAEPAGMADYSVPAVSADGEWLAFGQRISGGSMTRQLWLVKVGQGAHASEGLAITDDVMFTHGGYQWEPGGSRLVFQRLAYGRSDSLPEVVVWNQADGKTLLLAADGYQPVWIP